MRTQLRNGADVMEDEEQKEIKNLIDKLDENEIHKMLEVLINLSGQTE